MVIIVNGIIYIFVGGFMYKVVMILIIMFVMLLWGGIGGGIIFNIYGIGFSSIVSDNVVIIDGIFCVVLSVFIL